MRLYKPITPVLPSFLSFYQARILPARLARAFCLADSLIESETKTEANASTVVSRCHAISTNILATMT